MAPIRVAIIGVGNCASSLVQGVRYYQDAYENGFVPGLMHPRWEGTHDGLGSQLSQVIHKAPGCAANIVGILRDTGTPVVVNFLPVGSEMATTWYVGCWRSAVPRAFHRGRRRSWQ